MAASRQSQLPTLAAVGRSLTENLGLKIFAIVAAVILFSLVHGAGDAERSVMVDVVALLPPPEAHKLLLTTLPDQVRVTLRGRRTLVQTLGHGSLAPIQLDLRDPSKHFVILDADQLDLPAGVRVVQIAPANVPLEWAERVERRLPIVVPLVGHARDGLEVPTPVRVQPTFVDVIGPRAEVSELTEVQTQPIDMSPFGAGTQELRQPLVAPAEHARYASAAPVRVVVDVTPAVARRTLRHVSVSAVGGGARVELRPARVDVELEGDPGALDVLDEDAVLPTVDLTDVPATPNAALRPVTLTALPAGVRVSALTPAQVLVTPMR